MRGDETPVDFECPHCGQGFTLKACDAIYTDHIEDECSETCQSCGGQYQLRCASVHIEMESIVFTKVES